MPKACPVCKEEFTPVRKNQIHCSESCNQKIYYQRHKKARNAYNLKWKQTHREHLKRKRREHYEKDREKILDLIGRECRICSSPQNIHFHEMFGKPHENKMKYIIEHYNDFVPLCKYCHNGLHRLGKPKDKKIDTNELLSLLSLLYL